MRTLFLGNTDTVAMAPGAEDLSDDFLQKAATSAKRMVWMTDVDDLIVSSTALSPAFLSYVARMKGHASEVRAIALHKVAGRRPRPIADDDVAGPSALAEVLEALARDAAIDAVHPYIADEIAGACAEAAGAKGVSFGSEVGPAHPNVTRHLNDKAAFRDFAALLRVPMAAGAVCFDDADVHGAVATAIGATGSVILKMARHSSGQGNWLLRTDPNSSALGAAHAISVEDTSGAGLATAITATGLGASRATPVVVEAYDENARSFGVYYEVGSTSVSPLGAAEILNRPTVGGQFWSAETLADVPSDVLAWSQRLADYAQVIGYRGPLSIDIVEGRTMGHIATEVNGRHGGFSTIRALVHSLGLAREVEAGDVAVLIRHGLAIDAAFPEALERLDERGLLYDTASARGAVVMTEGFDGHGPYDVVILGPSRHEVVAMEAELLQLTA